MIDKRGRIIKHVEQLDAAEAVEVMTEALSDESLKHMLMDRLMAPTADIIDALWEYLALDEMSQDEINAEESRWLTRQL